MKRILLLGASLVLAFMITELIIAGGIGYPPYGVEYKVAYRDGGKQWTNVRKPYSKLYNVEGSTLTWVNNLGLAGTDVGALDSLIVVLGSSYVVAFQFKPSDIASSIYQAMLDSLGHQRNVINLGCSGHDPYDSWFRLKYYEDKFNVKTDDVILVLNSDNRDWFQRHKRPLDFKKLSSFGQVNTRARVKAMILARNASSQVELLAKAWKKTDDEGDAIRPNIDDSQHDDVSFRNTCQRLSEEMVDCLNMFSSEYAGFKVISTYTDADFNTALKNYCDEKGIGCYLLPMSGDQFMIGGAGHLNRNGNAALANALLALTLDIEHSDYKR